jgi:hypothetical protein
VQWSAEHEEHPEKQGANEQAGGRLAAAASRDRKLLQTAVDFWLSIVKPPR